MIEIGYLALAGAVIIVVLRIKNKSGMAQKRGGKALSKGKRKQPSLYWPQGSIKLGRIDDGKKKRYTR